MAFVLGPRLLPVEIRHMSSRLVPRIQSRTLATPVPSKIYDAVVIGAGPGGLTAASNLLDEGLNVCMIDPSFTAGRINEKYREVPSNTKVKMFAQWATGTKAFSKAIESAPEKNPYSKMMAFDQEKGCMLGDAIGVAQMLSDGLRLDERVESVRGKVTKLNASDGIWTLPEHDVKAKKVVLAQGSHPKGWPKLLRSKREFPHIQKIDLDTCLKPSELRGVVSKGAVVGVIGSSHSAVLAMKNLYEIEGVKIVNMYRSPLLYAEYKDDWILYDNTGLKGVAADWGREVLEHADPERLKRIDMKAEGAYADGNWSERNFYRKALKDCRHLVAAVGYAPNETPAVKGVLYPQGVQTHPHFDPHSGKFRKGQIDGEVIPGLYGAGIAYPETVTDRVGNVESAVGWFKFMQFLKRVGPEWANAD